MEYPVRGQPPREAPQTRGQTVGAAGRERADESPHERGTSAEGTLGGPRRPPATTAIRQMRRVSIEMAFIVS